LPAFPPSIQYSFGIPSHSNRKRARNKRNSDREEISQTIQCADDMIQYLKDTKSCITKLLEIVNSFGKVAEYEINIQKSLAFLYINKE
jgi:hypothetical protein